METIKDGRKRTNAAVRPTRSVWTAKISCGSIFFSFFFFSFGNDLTRSWPIRSIQTVASLLFLLLVCCCETKETFVTRNVSRERERERAFHGEIESWKSTAARQVQCEPIDSFDSGFVARLSLFVVLQLQGWLPHGNYEFLFALMFCRVDWFHWL